MGIFDAIKDIGSSIGGGLLDIGTSWLGNEFINKPNAKEAYERSKKASALSFERSYNVYKKRHQDTVKDMSLAGLNPILAASGGFNVGNPPQAATAQAFQASPPQYSGTKSGLNLAKQSETKQKSKKAFQETNKIRKEVGKVIQEVINLRAQKKLITQTEKEKMQNTLLLEKKWWKHSVEISKMELEGHKIAAEYRKLVAQTKILNRELIQLQKMSQVYEGPLGDILGYIKVIMSTLGINLGIIKGLK